MVETEIEDRMEQCTSKWWQKYEEHNIRHQIQVKSDCLQYLESHEVKALEGSSIEESLQIADTSDMVWREKKMLWLNSLDDNTRLKLMISQLTSSYRI
jgi:hypothetical protein